MPRKTPLSQRLAVALAANYIRLVDGLCRWTVVRGEVLQDAGRDGAPFIVAFWHNRLLLMRKARNLIKENRIAILISDHGDGELIAMTMTHFDMEARRGSSRDPRKPDRSKGGAGALKGLLSGMRSGYGSAVTPDGPRGPRQRAQAGVVQLSRLSGVPIVPISLSVRFGVQVKTWDRMLVPFPVPFGRATMIFGDPIPVPERGEDAREETRREVERVLNELTERADRFVGRDYLPPEPEAAAAPSAPLGTTGEPAP